MRVRTARWISTLAGLAIVVGGGVQIASAATSPNIGVITIMNADKTTVNGNVMLEAKVNDPAISKVAFAMNRVGSKALLPNLDAAPAGTSGGIWEAPFDTSVIDNAKYDIVAYGQRADKTMVKSATITMTIHNPVFKMTPAKVSAGRNVGLHLQYAPPHEDAKGIATAYQCVGTDPVTAEDLATRCDPASAKDSKPFAGLTVSVSLPIEQFITNPATGNAFDCAPDLCSAAITVEDLVMSGPLTIKTK